MKQQKNLTDRYIQLVESFIKALESGKSGVELEDIRSEIRDISFQLGVNFSVENPSHDQIMNAGLVTNKLNSEKDTTTT